MRNGRRVAGVAAILAAGLVLAACSSTGGGSSGAYGGGSSPTGSSSSPAGGGSSQVLTISGFAFHPDTLTASAGEKVTIAITNKDSTTHSFTLDNGSVSKDIPPGQTVDVTVTWPLSGSLGFHCRFHPSMTGTLKVG
jgi:plastocyanin